MEFLETSGVRSGVIEESIDQLVREQSFDTRTLIAIGEPPVRGANGSIEYYFDPHPTLTPEVRDDGSVDYTRVNVLQKVVPGQVLAKVIPEESGRVGFDIRGNILTAPSGEPAHLGRGTNTSFASPDELILKSDVSGHVRLAKTGLVEVVTVYVVNGDVNYTTGSIEFDGNVVVNGDVLSGFKVIATGEIEVKGVVEDARLEAGRNVVVRGGFIGAGKGIIKAIDDALIRYVHHQEVKVGGDIIITNEVMNARLSAGGKVRIMGGAALLAGGVTTAREFIECKTLGNERQVRTDVTILFHSELEQKLRALRQRVNELTEQLRKVEFTLAKMSKADENSGNVADEREEIYRSLYATKHELERSVESIEADYTFLNGELARMKNRLFVRVHGSIFPGVTISIAGVQMQIGQKTERRHFMIANGEIAGLEIRKEQ